MDQNDYSWLCQVQRTTIVRFWPTRNKKKMKDINLIIHEMLKNDLYLFVDLDQGLNLTPAPC